MLKAAVLVALLAAAGVIFKNISSDDIWRAASRGDVNAVALLVKPLKSSGERIHFEWNGRQRS
jgi:hypothetical protein